jgi:hypothetical protein
MDIIDWFQHEALELPRSRNVGDFATRLKEILDGYLTTSVGLTGSDYITESLKAAMPDITLLCKGLVEAVRYYLDGFPYRAYERVQDALVRVRPHIDELASSADISDALQFLYRIRLGEPGTISSYSREDLFHIPFEQVHRVSTQRYSIPGLPSLYLGGSVWVCWEEFGRPDFHRLQLARYRAVSSVQILDFGYRPALIAAAVHANWNTVRQGGEFARFFLAQAICWPILAGCSIKVLSPGAPFVPEYILPQMLLQRTRSSSSIHGIRYFSTKVGQHVDDPSAATNYVFPARARTASGYCADLRQQFQVSDPMSWSVLQHGGVIPMITREPPSWKLRFAEGAEVSYLHTDFWDCENKLNSLTPKSL